MSQLVMGLSDAQYCCCHHATAWPPTSGQSSGICSMILPKSAGTKTRFFGSTCSGIRANLMFQNLNPANIQPLALDFICRSQREVSQLDSAFRIPLPQCSSGCSLEPLHLSACSHVLGTAFHFTPSAYRQSRWVSMVEPSGLRLASRTSVREDCRDRSGISHEIWQPRANLPHPA